MQELNTDFAKICISPKPTGAPMGKVPLPILKELEHQARQNISTLNFTTTFAKTSSSCNSTLEKCQHSLKSTFKKVKSQIKKGADPEKVAKHGYEEACDYLDIWNKTLIIPILDLSQQITCSYTPEGVIFHGQHQALLRRIAEMTLLQPHLGETRHQELRNASFWPPSLFKSQLVKEGEDFLLKKAPQKTLRVLDPIRINPFVVPTTKEAPTGNVPMGAIPLKTVTSCFPLAGETKLQRLQGRFQPHNTGRGHGNPSFQSLLQSLTQSTSRRSPPFCQERLANKQRFIKRVKHYHQWLCTAIPLKAKLGQISSDSVRIQDPSKRPSSGRLYPVSPVKERYRKGGKCKISGFTVACF